MDIDNLDPGEDFAEAIAKSVGSCDILIAMIGRHWLDASDPDGNRRLDNPDDFVRLEISTALKRSIRVMPVLVDGAVMPRSPQLPEDLQPIVRRQAVELSHNRFATDSERIIQAINRAFEKVAAEEPDREWVRLDAERRQRDEKELLQAQVLAREAEQLLEAGQREKQRLEAEQREKERLESEQREKKRLETEQREKEHLEAEQRQHSRLWASGFFPSSASATLEPQQSQTLPASSPDTIGQNGILRLLQKWSFLPFGLVLVVWFFPYGESGNFFLVQGSPILLLLFGLWPIVVLCLHFFAFGRKVFLEAIISWVGCAIWVFAMLSGIQYGKPPLSLLLTTGLLLIGACIKTVLAAQRRRLG